MFAENARDQKLLFLIFYEKTYLKGSVASVFTLNRKGLAWDITGPGMEYRFFFMGCIEYKRSISDNYWGYLVTWKYFIYNFLPVLFVMKYIILLKEYKST